MIKEEGIIQKINFFMEEKIEVHVKLHSRVFLNGTIEKELKPGVYWFIDRKLNGIYLFLKDIYEIEQMKVDGSYVIVKP